VNGISLKTKDKRKKLENEVTKFRESGTKAHTWLLLTPYSLPLGS